MRYDLQPYVLSLRVTERCNVGCDHCSLSAKPTGRDMPFDLAREAIHKAAEEGIGLLHISGGEPLLYPHLPDIVKEGAAAGMVVEMVTSAYTCCGNETIELEMLRQLGDSGLTTILLSYDDGHARCVGIDRFTQFVRVAMEIGMEICIFGIEAPHALVTVDKIAKTLFHNGIDINQLEWARGMFSYVGRGAARLSNSDLISKISSARCPYVMLVPTLIPDGKFLLCPCAILQAELFTVGDYHVDGMSKVLNNLKCSPIYRMLGKFGPHMSLLKCGVDEQDIPFEICHACEKYLQTIATKTKSELEEICDQQDLDEIYVDYEALLPPHKKYARMRKTV